MQRFLRARAPLSLDAFGFACMHSPYNKRVRRGQAGDCALWDNRQLWHSATGGLPPDARRVTHPVA